MVPAGDLPRGTAAVSVGEVDWSATTVPATVGRLLDAADRADRATVDLVEALVRAVESGATEAVLGVAVELVLSQSARLAPTDRTLLLRAVTTLVRMPATRQALREGWIAWSQARAIVESVRHVDVAGRADVDALVGRTAHGSRDHEADALVDEVDWLVASVQSAAAKRRRRDPVETNRTVLPLRLAGSGTTWAEWDADHFPWVVQAIDDRADDRYPHETAPDLPDPDDESHSDAALSAAHRHAARVGRRNADRRALAMFELLCGRDATTPICQPRPVHLRRPDPGPSP